MVLRVARRSIPRHGEIQRKKAQTAGGGCRKPNKPETVAEAILFVATQHGEDGKGKDGLVGYLSRIARTHPRSFAALLGRVLTCQSTLADEVPPDIVYKTAEEIGEELRKRGVEPKTIYERVQ
jgi:hypothetical protein